MSLHRNKFIDQPTSQGAWLTGHHAETHMLKPCKMLCRNPCKIPYRTPCGNLYSHVIHRAGSYIGSSVDSYAETYMGSLSEIPMGIYTDSRMASYIGSCEGFYVGSHMGFFNRAVSEVNDQMVFSSSWLMWTMSLWTMFIMTRLNHTVLADQMTPVRIIGSTLSKKIASNCFCILPFHLFAYYI